MWVSFAEDRSGQLLGPMVPGGFARTRAPNGLDLPALAGRQGCRAAWRARLLFYDLRDGWQVRVPPRRKPRRH